MWSENKGVIKPKSAFKFKNQYINIASDVNT